MNTYQQHPLSAAWPAMQADEYQALKDSIEVIGIQNPITLLENMVIDGWHRYSAAVELGVACPVKPLGDVDPVDFVKSQNEARRNVTASQRAMAISAIYAWRPHGVNTGVNRVHRGVESRKGYIASEETRKKLSLAGKGRVFSRESIQKSVNARAGFRHSTATKKLLSELATGRVVSVETREKIAKSGIGRKWTDSQREKMLRIQRNEVTEEQRRNISKARGGRAFTVFGPDGVAHEFQTLSEAANRFGLDASNIHKCLIGKAKQTKGYTCQYVNPQAA